jgi:uncharacterized integral membrane protein
MTPMRLLRAVVALIILVLIVIFALSNKQVVALGFWPTGFTWETPLSVAVLVVAAVFFIGGALLGASGAAAARRRMRRAEARLRVVEAQRPPVTTMPPTMTPTGSQRVPQLTAPGTRVLGA